MKLKSDPKKYKIVVPVYKSELDHNEKLVVDNLLKLYNISNLCIVGPISISYPIEFSTFEKVKFNDLYFNSINGYNKLMLSREFYERFSNYKYILIHQLDAYLFKDELNYWCEQNFDYIGAPWFRDERKIVKLFRSKKIKERGIIFNKVGNGGLSLRKTKTFLDFISAHKNIINTNISHELYGIEDVFWSIIAPQYYNFKIPMIKKASRFSLDRKPKIGMELNNNELPYGCHGFEKKKTKDFWKKYIPKLI